MLDIYADADSLLVRPVNMRVDSLNAGSLYQADHIPGGKHPGHDLKLGRLRTQRRHGLRIGHPKPQLILKACFQRLFHSYSFLNSITESNPRLSPVKVPTFLMANKAPST